MFTGVRSVYGVIGVMLFLIAIYLVLTNANGVQTLVSNVSSGGVALTEALQGRTPSGG